MNLSEAKELLDANGITYLCEEFENESEYWSRRILFPYSGNAKPCKVIALIIPNNNGNKNIEIQFNQVGEDFIFNDLYFGEYNYELFDCDENTLENSIINIIFEIIQGKLAFIVVNSLKRRHFIYAACFDLNEDIKDYESALRRINKPKGFISKLTHSRKQYEIYDWSNYQCIIK